MKSYILVFLFLMSHLYSVAITKKEAQFKQTVSAVIQAFSNQDSVAINQLIDKKTGVYLLYREGVFDNYTHLSQIAFHDESFPQVMFSYAKGIPSTSLRYAKLPTYQCEPGQWNKKGLFVDTTKTSHLLSSICKSRNKLVPDNIEPKTITAYYQLEGLSRRVVLSVNELELVFYVSYIKGKWYLTIVDHVTSDCSA